MRYMDFVLTSSAFKAGGFIPVKYTCRGLNINPPLTINNVPAETNTLALIFHDPDAVNKDWLHWIVFNIPPTTTQIAEATLPSGAVQGKNDFGDTAYGGPCPPSGTHRYIFDFYALDKRLDLPIGASRQQVESALASHTLVKTSLAGLFSNQ